MVRAGPGTNFCRSRPTLKRDPIRVSIGKTAGARTLVAVPLLKDDELVGVIVIYRQEVRPFTEKEIELVKDSPAQS